MIVHDVYDQWERHDAEQEAELQKLPECSNCGYKIQSEYCFQINDEIICETCMKDFRVHTEDLIM